MLKVIPKDNLCLSEPSNPQDFQEVLRSHSKIIALHLVLCVGCFWDVTFKEKVSVCHSDLLANLFFAEFVAAFFYEGDVLTHTCFLIPEI